MTGDSVMVVLASHDGERFLPAQLDSILAQGHADFRLLVQDDGSRDGSPAILADCAARDPRVHVLARDPRAPPGAVATFSRLLSEALRMGADYVFCADQDDAWEPGKLATQLPVLRAAEGAGRRPALVHHDLVVVDQALAPLQASFWRYMDLRPAGSERPQRLLSRNEVTGCAMACNRALLELALPVPAAAVMHDWWLALAAAHFGALAPLPQALVRYRQHGANAIGAKSYWHGLNPLTNWAAGLRRGRQELLAAVAQAQAFRDRLGGRLGDTPAGAALAAFAGLPRQSRHQRLRNLRRHALWRDRKVLDAVLVLHLLLLPRGGLA